MTLELFGFIALLIFAVIGLGFVVGAIIVCLVNAIPGLKANRKLSRLEAERKLNEKIKEYELLHSCTNEEHELVVETPSVPCKEWEEMCEPEDVPSQEPEFIITEVTEEVTPIVEEVTEAVESTPIVEEEIVEDKTDIDTLLDGVLTSNLSKEDEERLKEILKDSL